MNLKKIATILILFPILLCTACGNESSSDTVSLKKMSDTVVEKMQTINRDENYCSLLSTSDELSKLLKEWSKCQPDDSTDILVIPITEKLVPSDSRHTFDEVNDTAKEYTIRRITAGLGGQLSSKIAGTAAMAASSLSGYSETFRIDADNFTDQMWIIPCTDSVGILVSFIDTGDNVATVSASYCNLPAPETREEILSLIFGASSYEEIGAYYLPS